MSSLSLSDSAWWVPRQVAVERTLSCRLGPLELCIRHTAGEWRVLASYGDETDSSAGAELTLVDGSPESDGYQRFMVADPDPRLLLQPVLADRPVVIRPRQPVFLPEGEEITLYVSTPVTVRIRVGGAERLLCEVPSLLLSDTWFGPSSQEGELCYSGRTRARHARAELPRRAHRVLTAVRIRNEADAPLPLDKLSLPVPMLSVFGAQDGTLWTESVSLLRRSVSDLAALEIDAGAPAPAGPARLISPPRQPRAPGGLVRAFSMLFGDGS